ncbi:UNVERIFIED_CONTAM: Serine/threonine-protein kinase 36, partial [Sesamum indicum]
YAPGGALADKLRNSDGGGMPESEVRVYTKALLKGNIYIHKFGYVHCDIKLQNIFLGANGRVKIGDFGLAKRDGGRKGAATGCELRGTPLYISPEMVVGGKQGPPADIWALGCVVAEMLFGNPAWRCSDIAGWMMRIEVGEEVPEIPRSLSKEGRDFLCKYFVKDPSKRWTVEML